MAIEARSRAGVERMAAPSQAAGQNIWAEADAAALGVQAESVLKIVRSDALDLRVLP